MGIFNFNNLILINLILLSVNIFINYHKSINNNNLELLTPFVTCFLIDIS